MGRATQAREGDHAARLLHITKQSLHQRQISVIGSVLVAPRLFAVVDRFRDAGGDGVQRGV